MRLFVRSAQVHLRNLCVRIKSHNIKLSCLVTVSKVTSVLYSAAINFTFLFTLKVSWMKNQKLTTSVPHWSRSTTKTKNHKNEKEKLRATHPSIVRNAQRERLVEPSIVTGAVEQNLAVVIQFIGLLLKPNYQRDCLTIETDTTPYRIRKGSRPRPRRKQLSLWRPKKSCWCPCWRTCVWRWPSGSSRRQSGPPDVPRPAEAPFCPPRFVGFDWNKSVLRKFCCTIYANNKSKFWI